MIKTRLATAINSAFDRDRYLDRMTRNQAIRWLEPIRKAMADVKTGEVDAIRGYAVTRLDERDEYARIDWALNGFMALLKRLGLRIDLSPAERMSKRLSSGVPLTEDEVDYVLEVLDQAESRLVGLPIRDVKDAVMIEQLDIELSALGLKEAA